MNKIIRVLYIESDSVQIARVATHLQGLQLTHVSTLVEGRDTLKIHPFDLILTNLNLQDIQGIDTLRELQKDAHNLPIIILTARQNENLSDEAIRVGAQDFLLFDELESRLLEKLIRFAIERNHLLESLKALSFTDELTGLYNRRGLLTLLEQQVNLSQRTKRGFCFFIADLDYLKSINDTYGHIAGDHALMASAHLLRDSFRRHDIVGRLGGDEFGIIAINASPMSHEPITHHVHEVFQKFNDQKIYPFSIHVSIGSVHYDGESEITIEQLLHQADLGLYEAKKLTH